MNRDGDGGRRRDGGAAPLGEPERSFTGSTLAVVLLLSATSGIVDAVAFARFGVFVANQTGNLVIVALGLAQEQSLQTRVASIIALVTFTLGVFLAVWIRNMLRRRLKQHEPDGSASTAANDRARSIMLGLEAALIAVAGVGIAMWGTKSFAYVAVALLSLSQAVQAVVVTRIVGIAIQTVVINTALVESAEALGRGKRRVSAIAFGTPVGYLLGALIGALLVRQSPPADLVLALVTATAAAFIAHRIARKGAEVE